MKSFFKLYGKWLIATIPVLAFAIFFIIVGILRSDEFIDDNLPTVPPFVSEDTTTPYATFNSTYAKVGSPLKVSLVNVETEDELSYTWYINNTKVDGATSDTYTPKVSDREKFVSVKVTCGRQTYAASLYVSDLPVIYISTPSGSDEVIGDEYTDAFMAMSGSEEYNTSNSDFYHGNILIKYRGNSTRGLDKHPYKIKLETSSNLYGMGANKHWVLLANAIDHTLIRNKLVYDLSGALGSDYMESRNVVLILNNDYKGVYQLCEQIRVGSTRIDITSYRDIAKEAATIIADIKQKQEDMSSESAAMFVDEMSEAMENDLSWLSAPYKFKFKSRTYVISDYVEIPPLNGGYILEMDFYSFGDISSIKTNYQQPIYFNSPDPQQAVTNQELLENARKYIQSFEYALHSFDFTFHNNETHYAGTGLHYDSATGSGWIGQTEEANYKDPENDNKHYTELFDFDSLVNNFIICEFTMNWDSMKNSMFITKDVNALAKLAPVWDFDWAFGNINMYNIETNFPESWHTTNEYFTNEQYYQSVQWNRFLIKDPYFLAAVYNKYKEIRPTLIEDIIKTGGTLDTYRRELQYAAEANDARWGYTYSSYRSKMFGESFDSLKEFIVTRVEWLDKQFATFDTFVNSLGYYTGSNEINVVATTSGKVTIKTSNKDIKSVYVQVNGKAYKGVHNISNGEVQFTLPSDILGAKNTNVINVMALDANGNYITVCTADNNATADDYAPIQNYKLF